MTTALTLKPSSELAPEIIESLAGLARGYAGVSMAANTRTAYASDWRDFEAFCQEIGAATLPASSATVALYLTARAQVHSVATLGRRLAAIRTAHKVANETPPAGGELRQVWAGIRRAHGRPPAQKRALVADDVRRAVQAMPNTLAGLRDRALILVGFGGALRRSELVGLEIDAKGAGPARARFVAGGLEIHLDRSKADQEGKGAVVAIPHGQSAATCAVRALQEWLKASGITEGPIFRPVNRWGQVSDKAMTPHAAALVVKAAAERIGLDPEAFAAHSLRAGLATSAAANDAPADLIMSHMRHRRFDTTRRYIREGERFKRNAAKLTGL